MFITMFPLVHEVMVKVDCLGEWDDIVNVICSLSRIFLSLQMGLRERVIAFPNVKVVKASAFPYAFGTRVACSIVLEGVAFGQPFFPNPCPRDCPF
eukprot:1921686-Heterocapsa_arctica.AAC.1